MKKKKKVTKKIQIRTMNLQKKLQPNKNPELFQEVNVPAGGGLYKAVRRILCKDFENHPLKCYPGKVSSSDKCASGMCL